MINIVCLENGQRRGRKITSITVEKCLADVIEEYFNQNYGKVFQSSSLELKIALIFRALAARERDDPMGQEKLKQYLPRILTNDALRIYYKTNPVEVNT